MSEKLQITASEHKSPLGMIRVFRITNSKGASVMLSSLGAAVAGVVVPDREGKLENVALAYKEPEAYIADGPCLGKVPGRYANRIAGGRLNVAGQDYALAVNNGPNHLHGGPMGFQNKIWHSEEIPDGVRFYLLSPDGDENYPGNLRVAAEYHWNDENELTLNLSAVSDAATVVNLTSHAYWNLDGADSGNALGHQLQMKASRWLPTDETLIPTGEMAPVDGTPMDFTSSKPLGRDIEADFDALRYGKGYDNCWVFDNWTPGGMIRDAVVLKGERSGRVLRIDTDQPGVQVYTGNWLAGSPANRSGRGYEDYDGVAIEAQGFPDAPNRPAFPTQELLPGETYSRTIRFRFTVE